MASATTTWVLTDGRAGNEKQALALARALARLDRSASGEPRVWRLQAQAPWKQAAPRRLPGCERAFGDAFRQALQDPPRLAIGCGRQAALATRLLREAGARVVQILDPRLDPKHWDVVVVPEHDRLRGPNVVVSPGSLHEVDAEWLAAARARFPEFGALPSPRTLLLLGGPTRGVPLDAAWWQDVAAALRASLGRDGGSLSICASRRTPRWLAEAAARDGAGLAGMRWFGEGDGPNPYAGLLGWAERIVVTPDSVNMLSEACASVAEVAVASPGIATGKHARFLASMFASGRARPLGAASATRPSAGGDMERIAIAVRDLLERRDSSAMP